MKLQLLSAVFVVPDTTVRCVILQNAARLGIAWREPTISFIAIVTEFSHLNCKYIK